MAQENKLNIQVRIAKTKLLIHVLSHYPKNPKKWEVGKKENKIFRITHHTMYDFEKKQDFSFLFDIAIYHIAGYYCTAAAVLLANWYHQQINQRKTSGGM